MAMPASGTSTCSNPGDYESHFRDGRIDLVFTRWGEFKARLTWVELHRLHLLRSDEGLPRIAYVSLAPERVFIGFPSHHDPPQIWGGVELTPSDIVLHARGERLHQRTSAASRWGLVSVLPAQLAGFGKALIGVDLVVPPVAKILRPPTLAKAQLLRLHAQACRLAETKPEVIAHREVARALEHDMFLALVACLAVDDVREIRAEEQRHARIMVRFEDAFAARCESPLRIADLCSVIGISERELRISCAEVLGMSPSRYLRLRRLNMVRAALRSADPGKANIADTARRYGFSQRGHFAASYRRVFGETPSTTVYGSRARDSGCPKVHRRRKHPFSP
jgi:AraC-like DNA-binding protein